MLSKIILFLNDFVYIRSINLKLNNMKKITTLCICLAASVVGFSQIAATSVARHEVTNFKKTQKQHKTTTSFSLDYDAAEEDLAGTTPGYSRFGWDVKDYPSAAGDTATLNNFIVSFDSIYDYTTFSTYQPGVDYVTWSIDTLFVALGHENNSGQSNSIIISVLPLTGGYPNPSSTPIWDTTITTSTSLSTSTPPSWLNFSATQSIYTTALHNMPSSQKVAVMVEFQAPDQDTLGVIAGYTNNTVSCAQNPALDPSAVTTAFPNNTVAQWSDYQVNGTLPTATGANIYYECNGVAGAQFPADGTNFIQNGGIWMDITIDDGVSVEELGNNEVNYNVYPNPSNTGIFNIDLAVNSDDNVNLTVRNIVGQTVLAKTVANGESRESISLADFSKGVYFLTVGSKTTKLIVE